MLPMNSREASYENAYKKRPGVVIDRYGNHHRILVDGHLAPPIKPIRAKKVPSTWWDDKVPLEEAAPSVDEHVAVLHEQERDATCLFEYVEAHL